VQLLGLRLKLKILEMSIKDVGKYEKNKKSSDYHSQRREDNPL
jgi:hypothetical protein